MQFDRVKALVSVSGEVGYGLGHVPDIRIGWQRRGYLDSPPRDAVLLEEGQATPGALSDTYNVPAVCYVTSRSPLWVALTLAAVVLFAARRLLLTKDVLSLVSVWGIGFVMRVVPLSISWFDKPFTTTAEQGQALDRLCVVVAVPVYNEHPMLLDRCLWSLVNQSRQPDVIHVVEDGPSADYSILRNYWLRQRHGRVRVEWTRQQENNGKKFAQSVVFVDHPEADIFVTVDSDTTLEHRAVEEGMKPFADPSIMSVAGVEENFNKDVNWLTRSVAIRNTYNQLTVWGTQSIFGDVLVNRGTFALYRARVIREIVPAYVCETFLGRPIRLGDDAALTLFSQAYGRTVQQVSAFSLPMHPEELSHHFRQWLRWARGWAIRNCWRLRYLEVKSYGFWWTLLVWYTSFMSAAVPIVLLATWPQSERALEIILVGAISWSYLVSVRALSVRRSDDSVWSRIGSMLLCPTGGLWFTLVLRPVRLYGMATFLKQQWITRQTGPESMNVPAQTPVPEPPPMLPVQDGVLS
jgi:hyaluronan synthase